MNITVEGGLCYVNDDIDYVKECFERNPQINEWVMLLPRESLTNDLFSKQIDKYHIGALIVHSSTDKVGSSFIFIKPKIISFLIEDELENLHTLLELGYSGMKATVDRQFNNKCTQPLNVYT